MLLCHFEDKEGYEILVALLSPKHLESLRQLPLPPAGTIGIIYRWEEAIDYFRESDLLSGFAESANWQTRYSWGEYPLALDIADEKATPLIEPRGKINVSQALVNQYGQIVLTAFNNETYYEAYLRPEYW